MNWNPCNIWRRLKHDLPSPEALGSLTSEATILQHLQSRACPPYLSAKTSCRIDPHLYVTLEATIKLWQLRKELDKNVYRPRGHGLPVPDISLNPPAFQVHDSLTPAKCPICRNLPAYQRCSVVVSVSSLSDAKLDELKGAVITAADPGDCISPRVSSFC